MPHLEKAVEIQPKITQNRLNLAAALVDAKQFSRAQTILDAIVREHPTFPGAWFNLGVLHDEQRQPADARDAYVAEVNNYPSSFKAPFNLGKVLTELGDWKGSIDQMREVVRIARTNRKAICFSPAASSTKAGPWTTFRP